MSYGRETKDKRDGENMTDVSQSNAPNIKGKWVEYFIKYSMRRQSLIASNNLSLIFSPHGR